MDFRRWLAVVAGLCLFVSYSHAIELNTSRYDVYYGDVNSDGYSDIYFRGKPLHRPLDILLSKPRRQH